MHTNLEESLEMHPAVKIAKSVEFSFAFFLEIFWRAQVLSRAIPSRVVDFW